MPIQQIAVVSQYKPRMDNSGMEIAQGGGDGKLDTGVKVDRRDKNKTVIDVVSVQNSLLDNPDATADTGMEGCDTASVTDVTESGAGESTEVDVINTHIEADTVILGDTNSDCMSDSTGRQTLDGADCPIQIQPVDPNNMDTSNNACVTQNEKRTNPRTGKTTKKEKLAPIKKKDSNTQETLHPNSPTPISAERCDSSMSNMDSCRICQCDTCEIQKESPLVAPCLCAGSLKFVHQACLQKWIKSSNKMSCELCHFDYQMTRKTKPFREWERLDMTQAEKRKVVCSVTFHVIAITCVVWSLYVLIDRTTEEVEAGSLQWPFWTKLIVVAIGFTGGVVFMYVQCKLYLNLCKKWRTYNKVILVSSISETTRDRANHEGIMRMTEKQAQLEEERRTNFDVFTIVHESESF